MTPPLFYLAYGSKLNENDLKQWCEAHCVSRGKRQGIPFPCDSYPVLQPGGNCQFGSRHVVH